MKAIRGYAIDIDGKKLEKALYKRGITKVRASEECGHARNYLERYINQNQLPRPISVFLKSAYNIDESEYAVTQQEEVKETPAPQLDMDALGKLIYKAVYNAVKDALS